ncbi:hypothetical protein ACDW_37270 [Acidovorax sp. DW039]|uniref:hypothetical protein n=1 Tax=Acidovorax sp. DW039 TaxID=3095606 RepID=UPI00308D7CF3|nr:hypothetical protein ACDW_37270 [Acidovorax sp. DW039]
MNLAKTLWMPLALLAAAAQAQPSGPPPSGERPPISAEMKAAFEACMSQGKPGDAAFDACMTAKGFKKPEGQPPAR